jgi:hypothetical protein
MFQPLAAIMFVSALRAAVEDRAKHVNDTVRNSYLYDKLVSPPANGAGANNNINNADGNADVVANASGGGDKDGWRATASGDLRIGDIIVVKEGDMIPTDLLMLVRGARLFISTKSHATLLGFHLFSSLFYLQLQGSAKPKGNCEIDKANLNGETALEVYNSFPATQHMTRCFTSAKSFSADDRKRVTANLNAFKASVNYEPAHARFFACRGQMTIEAMCSGDGGGDDDNDNNKSGVDGSGSEGELGTHDIEGEKYMLMRETALKNTPFIIGLVLYVVQL